MKEQCNEQSWSDSVVDSGTVMVEKWNSVVERRNSDGGMVW